MYYLYRLLTLLFSPLVSIFLLHRKAHGKENVRSVAEKTTTSFTRERDDNISKLLWIHGASVGEAQSSLILIETLLDTYPDLHIMITTGTLTSANLMESRLPKRAFHQFCPLDHPKYTKKFLDHWRPDAAIWMESELWPNTLHELARRKISTTLVNAHMSSKSFKIWHYCRSLAKTTMSTFDKVLCQSENDKILFNALGAQSCIVTDNIKYSATPLFYDCNALDQLKKSTENRSLWLYASSHDGEEELACRIHEHLKTRIPDLLTIIVPRHPERRNTIALDCSSFSLKLSFRGEDKENLPAPDDDIYIADTLGELGLFYALCPIACIGRSFSHDGGGGHNPIEAAQLGCAVLHGPNVQNLHDIYTQMHNRTACLRIENEKNLEEALHTLFISDEKREALQRAALSFAQDKTDIIDNIIKEIAPQLEKLCTK
ncbi:MAG: 3-deoxy-D-manno-octulosonic acid transferase [Alphaproteobacteria bacterium]|nr:3-deoxy-D-manno-octulosonic acid transferase [Alphaproteobacteria bacterium]